MAPTMDIPTPVRVQLAHAAVQASVRRAGVDALLIKGYATDPGLRCPDRSSTDVDVLVRPAHVRRTIEALKSQGWATMTTFRSGSLFQHAQTMHHPAWGLVDVHRSFPGFEDSPEETFRALWGHRTTAHVAHYPCDVPRVLDQALLIIVHAARTTESGRHDIRHLKGVLTPEDWRAVERRALELQCHIAFCAAVGRLAEYRHHPSHDLWAVLSHGGTRSQEWRARMRAATTMRQKLRLAVSSPLPNLDHMRMDLGHTPTPLQIVKATLERPLRAACELLLGRARLNTPQLIHSVPQEVAPQQHRPARSDSAATSSGNTGVLLADPPESTGAGEHNNADHGAHPAVDSLRPGPHMAVADLGAQAIPDVGPCVFLARVPDSPPQILSGPAAVIWHAARSVPPHEVASRVAAMTGLRPEEIADDVTAFVEELTKDEFLVGPG